jgi:signal transduction histidine kinase
MKRNVLHIVVVIIFGVFILSWTQAQSPLRSKPQLNVSLGKDSIATLDSLVNLYKSTDPPLAIHYAMNAMKVARITNSPEEMTSAYMLMAMVHFNKKKDSSFYYNNLALTIADSAGLTAKMVPILYNIAMIHSAAHDFKQAITLLDSSVALAQVVNDPMGMARGYNELGNIKVIIHDSLSLIDAQKMYTIALEIATKANLKLQQSVALGSLARLDSDVKSAISKLKIAMGLLKGIRGAEEEMARFLINIGDRYYNVPDSAIYYNLAAIQLCSEGSAPDIIMAAYNNLAYNYLDKRNYVKAEEYLKNHAIPLAEKEGNDDWLSSLNDTYADILAAKGDFANAFKKQKLALQKRNEANIQFGTEQLRLISALLDLKNKELIIQNEQRELLVQKNRIQNMELWLIGLVLLVVSSILFTYLLQQRNKTKLHQEQMASARKLIEMEEGEKGRTARELHDITGQLVMGINSEIENLDLSDLQGKEALQNNIRALGASIRRISHRMNRAMIEHLTFPELIESLCEDVQRFSGLKVKLEMPDPFPELPQEAILHLYRIVQEMLTNASKYALNSDVKITLTTTVNLLTLDYTDNGPGFEKKEKNLSGMGLMNIFERVKLIGGKAIVNSSPGNGTTWNISVPLHQKESVKK